MSMPMPIPMTMTTPRLRLVPWFQLLIASLCYWGGGVLGRAADEVLVPVTAEHGEIDFKTGLHHLSGNVNITLPSLVRLQCDDYYGVAPEDNAAATNVTLTAQGNVRLHLTTKAKGTNAPMQLMATAEKAVYTGTNQLFTLTGNPQVVSAYGVLSGTVIHYDVGANKAMADAPHFLPNSTMLTNLLERARQKVPATKGTGK